MSEEAGLALDHDALMIKLRVGVAFIAGETLVFTFIEAGLAVLGTLLAILSDQARLATGSVTVVLVEVILRLSVTVTLLSAAQCLDVPIETF